MDSTSVSSTTMGILLNEATERPFQTGLLTISLTILGYISFRGLFRNGSDADEETLSKRKYPLPPGPPRDFLIGSLRHFPSSRIWEKFTEWQKLYGYIPTAVTNAVSKLIIDLTYGEAVREEMGDELTDSNQEIMHLAEYALFNAWIVDFLHFLRFIPSWFPGANFKRIGDRSIKLSDYIRFAPFKVIQELHNSGKLGHSIATDLLGEFGPNEDTQDALAVLNTAGSDTVWTMNSLLDHTDQFHIIDHCGNLRLSARYVPLSRYCRQGL
ncbi:hypothetical protein FRB91_009445 [Serendipita sp. 411]|nr:hypothetical protein FRB91_009445 [Serendipita sp. 411]